MAKYTYYLGHVVFRWRTDNSALTSIQKLNCPSGVVIRWLGTLADFKFEVEHRPGKKHCNADGLSRSGCAEYISENDDEDGEAHDSQTMALIGEPMIPRAFRQKYLLQGTRDEMCAHQDADEDLGKMRRWVREGEPPNRMVIRSLSRSGKIWVSHYDSLILGIDGVLRYRAPNQLDENPRLLTCLPKAMWDDVIKIAHQTGGHMSDDKTYRRLKMSVFFPNMSAEVRGYINTCNPCQTKDRAAKDQRHTLISPLAGYPFQLLGEGSGHNLAGNDKHWRLVARIAVDACCELH
jgi:hypothetical protein